MPSYALRDGTKQTQTRATITEQRVKTARANTETNFISNADNCHDDSAIRNGGDIIIKAKTETEKVEEEALSEVETIIHVNASNESSFEMKLQQHDLNDAETADLANQSKQVSGNELTFIAIKSTSNLSF